MYALPDCPLIIEKNKYQFSFTGLKYWITKHFLTNYSMITTGLFTFHDRDLTHWIDSFVLTMEINQVESKKRRFDEARSEWGEFNESPDTSRAYAMPARNSVEELSAVMDLKSRSGKWTRPEEDYANAIIKYFDNGQLADGIPGETLRKYLCKKLVCKQMRISKKYSGTLIGKVFLEIMNIYAFFINLYSF